MVVDMAKPGALLRGTSRAVVAVATPGEALGEAVLSEREHSAPLAGRSRSSCPRERG